MPFVDKTAKALYLLHEHGHLQDPDFKEAIHRFIRNATETDRWHLTTHYRSQDALQRIREAAPRTEAAYHDFCKHNLRHEHMVPDSVIYKLLCRTKSEAITLAYLQGLLRTFGLRATITLEENTKYLGKSLTSNMPPSFYQPEHEHYCDPLARYKVSGLLSMCEKRETSTWWPLPASS